LPKAELNHHEAKLLDEGNVNDLEVALASVAKNEEMTKKLCRSRKTPRGPSEGSAVHRDLAREGQKKGREGTLDLKWGPTGGSPRPLQKMPPMSNRLKGSLAPGEGRSSLY